MHGDEVYFRDTAHGFLAWCIATLVTATLVVGSVSNIVSGGVQAGATVAGGAASAMTQAVSDADSDPYGYFIDSLFRDDRPVAVSDDAAYGIVTRIFARSLSNDGQLAVEDRAYLAQLIAQRTNLTQADAERRVDEVYARTQKAVADAKMAAEQAAKAAALTALWMFVALLAGAFFASLAAIFGGRRRDAVEYLETDAYVTTTTTTTLPPVR